MARGFRSFRREPSNLVTSVTYYVDTNANYTEEVPEGKSALSPSSFTPTKSGYSFLGWREDSVASSDVLVEKKAKGKTLSLYAVFTKDITLTTYNASNSPTSTTKTQYYNNANIVNPTFVMSETAISGWTNAGWTNNINGYTATVADGATITLSSNAEYYTLYTQTITVTYYNGSATPSYATGTRIANVHSASTFQNPTFQLAQAGLSGWTARGWTTSASGGESAISYGNNVAFTRDTNIVLYGCYYRTATITYDPSGAGGTGSGYVAPSTGTAYYHSTSGATDAQITLSSSGFTPPSGTVPNPQWLINKARYPWGSVYNTSLDVTAKAVYRRL